MKTLYTPEKLAKDAEMIAVFRQKQSLPYEQKVLRLDIKLRLSWCPTSAVITSKRNHVTCMQKRTILLHTLDLWRLSMAAGKRFS